MTLEHLWTTPALLDDSMFDQDPMLLAHSLEEGQVCEECAKNLDESKLLCEQCERKVYAFIATFKDEWLMEGN